MRRSENRYYVEMFVVLIIWLMAIVVVVQTSCGPRETPTPEPANAVPVTTTTMEAPATATTMGPSKTRESTTPANPPEAPAPVSSTPKPRRVAALAIVAPAPSGQWLPGRECVVGEQFRITAGAGAGLWVCVDPRLWRLATSPPVPIAAPPVAPLVEPESSSVRPRYRAVDHPINPAPTDYTGFPVGDGEGGPWCYEAKFERSPADALPWRICQTWTDQAVDHQETCIETGAAPTVTLEFCVPLRRPDGEPFARFGQRRWYALRVWRNGELIGDMNEGMRFVREVVKP